MATTGELRAIIEELQLIDAGDAASYLGEEVFVGEESTSKPLKESMLGAYIGMYGDYRTSPREDTSFR